MTADRRTLTAVRKGFFSRDFSLADGSAPFAEIEFPGWSDQAVLRVDGTGYEARREGWLGNRYLLERGGSEIVRAESAGFFSSAFIVSTGNRTFKFDRKGVFSATFVLSENGTVVGEVARRGFWRSSTTADLPPDLEPAVRAFLVWLAVVRWRAQEGAAAAAG